MPHELRDPEEARAYLLASLCWARARALSPEAARCAVEVALGLAGDGEPLPPLGVLADLGLVVLAGGDPAPPLPVSALPGADAGLLRRYEDYVLGKFIADRSLERGGDALARYPENQRLGGLTYLAQRLCERTGSGGVLVSPAVLRALGQLPSSELVAEAWRAATQMPEELQALLSEQLAGLVAAVQATGDLLGSEDVFELEQGTALVEFGQRLALRQTLQMAERLLAELPQRRARPPGQKRQVATRMLTEDAYPVGGFSSLSTKGSVESLLHSQLAFLERDARPDLFDIKFVRDELLYYSRDENQFLRRRTTVFVVLAPDLAAARVKDAGLPCQRIVAVLGLLAALVRRLTEWLASEALAWRFVVLADGGGAPLGDEQELLAWLFASDCAAGHAQIQRLDAAALHKEVATAARTSLTHLLVLAAAETALQNPAGTSVQLLCGGATPHLWQAGEAPYWSEERGLSAYRDVLSQLLERLE